MKINIEDKLLVAVVSTIEGLHCIYLYWKQKQDVPKSGASGIFLVGKVLCDWLLSNQGRLSS